MTQTQNLTEMSRDALRKIAADLKIPGRGNMLKPELVAAIEAIQNDRKITGMAEKMAARVIESRAASGTVHVETARGEVISAPVTNVTITPAPARIPGTPLAESQRRDNYRRQNGSPRLTARQERRIRHKANRAAR